MADAFGQKNSTGLPVPPRPPERGTGTPSSLAEVTVRTMASDLESLGASGGVAVPTTVQVPALPSASEAPRQIMAPTSSLSNDAGAPAAPERSTALLFWIIGGATGLIILFLIGYFVVPLIMKKGGGATAGNGTGDHAAPAGSADETITVHESAFRAPADAVRIVQDVSSASYRSKLAAAADGLPIGAGLADLAFTDGSGQPLSWNGFLARSGLELLSPQFFSEHFTPDFTGFVFKDSNGVWPGYILKLEAGESPLLLYTPTLAVERDANGLAGFFATEPGQSAGGFTDVQVSNQPVRSLVFSTGGASFNYGWFHGTYLVISTSLEGMRQAVLHL